MENKNVNPGQQTHNPHPNAAAPEGTVKVTKNADAPDAEAQPKDAGADKSPEENK